MRESLNICGINMCLDVEDAYLFNDCNYKPFYLAHERDTDISVVMSTTVRLLELQQNFLRINTTCSYYDETAKSHLQWDIAMLEEDGKKCRSWMSANTDWSTIKIYANKTPLPPYLETNYLISAFSSRLSYFGGFVMHGSVVEHNGLGVVFTASSGVGKTTHAELWAKHFADPIINGDRAVLRVIGEEVFVYGSPWSGSSVYVVNSKAPLAAIIVLEQADVNQIRKLNILESLQYFATHCYLPVWSGELTALCMKTLDEVLKRTPVYLLQCRPDQASAELVRDTIF
ncbi:MAG: hypothetical protein GXY05_15950 [Clostridiales bacterium]|nr:hypothetical protein [Clostridiales bacterium]